MQQSSARDTDTEAAGQGHSPQRSPREPAPSLPEAPETPQSPDRPVGPGSPLSDAQNNTPAASASPGKVASTPATQPAQATPKPVQEAAKRISESVDRPQPGADAGPTYTVGGMVGQVNGQAIYASQVLKPLHEQLRALGRKLSRAEFRERAQELIVQRLRSIITDRLILGKAMRNLSDREKQGLDRIMRQRRQALVRRYGRGAESVAAQNLREQTGKTLDQRLEDIRQQIVVGRYLKQELRPRVSVSRHDVEHYYNTHEAEYQPGVVRKIRLIRARDDVAANKIRSALQSGDGFKQVAGRELNAFKASENGLLGQQRGEAPLQGPLNDVLADLEQGEWGGPVTFNGSQWFVYCEKLERQKGQSLRQVQLEIRNKLRRQRFRELQSEYQQQLFEEGSYASLADMGRSLLKIAMSRYAPPADQPRASAGS